MINPLLKTNKNVLKTQNDDFRTTLRLVPHDWIATKSTDSVDKPVDKLAYANQGNESRGMINFYTVAFLPVDILSVLNG